MKNFSFYSPTYFAFGKDTENEAGAYVKQFGGTKVLVHYGGGSVIRSGLLYRVTTSLEKEGIPPHFIEELSDRETAVKKVSIVPLEVIVRNVAAGSFSKRLGV